MPPDDGVWPRWLPNHTTPRWARTRERSVTPGSFMAKIRARGYLIAGVDQDTCHFGYLDPFTGQGRRHWRTVGYQAPEVPTVGPSPASDLHTVGRALAVLTFEFSLAAILAGRLTQARAAFEADADLTESPGRPGNGINQAQRVTFRAKSGTIDATCPGPVRAAARTPRGA